MADSSNRTDSVQVTCTDTISPKSLCETRHESLGICPPPDSLERAEAQCGLSSAMQRAVANYCAAREHYNSLAVDSGPAENDRAEAAYLNADQTLPLTPAENLHDLRAKFDAIWGDNGSTPNEATLQAVFADFRRLTGDTVSAVFSPSLWLDYFEKRGGAYVVRAEEVFLLEPGGTDLANNMFELEALGGKPAIEELIRHRCAQEAGHD